MFNTLEVEGQNTGVVYNKQPTGTRETRVYIGVLGGFVSPGPWVFFGSLNCIPYFK